MPRLTLRIDFDEGRAIGPGNINVLELIDALDLIGAAGAADGHAVSAGPATACREFEPMLFGNPTRCDTPRLRVAISYHDLQRGSQPGIEATAAPMTKRMRIGPNRQTVRSGVAPRTNRKIRSLRSQKSNTSSGVVTIPRSVLQVCKACPPKTSPALIPGIDPEQQTKCSASPSPATRVRKNL